VACQASGTLPEFPVALDYYRALEAGRNLSLLGTLWHRIQLFPFNLVATTLFLCAIGHTFFASKFAKLSAKIGGCGWQSEGLKHFAATLCHFLGEVEVIFGLWVVPLLCFMAISFGWKGVGRYFNGAVSFTEPIFVVVIMAIAATKPILSLSEAILGKIASIGGSTVSSWWAAILMITPFMGSFITEPAAMTIAAMLLVKQFYILKPTNWLRYATLGLLFVNISIGGTLTHFAAPPILMVAHRWELSLLKVFSMLGVRAIAGVVASTLLYLVIFRKEFAALQRKNGAPGSSTDDRKIPPVIAAAHCLFLAWTVVNLHTPALVVFGFLFFLAFVEATKQYQGEISLRSPLLVGFFLAGLVTHGGLQEWWISPVLGGLREFPLFIGSTILTAFNDNAAITYLASLVSEFSTNQSLQMAVLSGAVTGGGLTVIANAPNPAGQSILFKYFDGHVSPLCLFAGAIIPTIVVAICFNCL
jgi:Na+/H+ antiporter NhaD/arsenite permease-like protein